MPASKKDAYVEKLLSTAGVPVAFQRFIPYKNKPVPNPPYIVYFISPVSAGGADDKNLYVKKTVTLDVYSKTLDEELQRKIEAALTAVKWVRYEDYIEAETLYVTSYEFEIYEKLGGL